MLHNELYSPSPINLCVFNTSRQKQNGGNYKGLREWTRCQQVIFRTQYFRSPSFRRLFCRNWIISNNLSGLLGNVIIPRYKLRMPSFTAEPTPKKTPDITEHPLPSMVRAQSWKVWCVANGSSASILRCSPRRCEVSSPSHPNTKK